MTGRMINISNEIQNASNSILKRRKYISSKIIEKISDVLIDKLSRKSTPILTHDDLLSISTKLNLGSPRSYQTRLYLDCLNQIIFELKKTESIDSPYFNIPQKISRHIITQFDERIFENVRYIQKLRDELLKLEVSTHIDSYHEDIDYICSFIASAAIFGKILFPKFHEALLNIRFQDISISPDFINIRFENYETYYRYYLPFPASLYLYRCILFYQKYHRKLGIKRPNKPDGIIFRSIENFSEKFKKWTIDKLKGSEFENSYGLNLPAFRKAAVTASVIDSIGDDKNSDPYPPFIIAIQSREIESYSYENKYLPSFLGHPKYIPVLKENLKIGKKKTNYSKNLGLESILTNIRNIRRPLLKMAQCKLNVRQEAAEKIKSTVESNKYILNNDDYKNLRLYAEWVSSLLLNRKYSIKTVNDYSSDVQEFLHNLSIKGSIPQLSLDQLVEIMKQTMDHRNSRGIKSRLKAFTDFLKIELGSDFSEPNWKRSKDLRKKDIPTFKPLIDFEKLAEALEISKYFFAKYIDNYKKISIKMRERKRAEHKALVIWHIICLCFYTGLRISEAVNLKVNNVIFDGGIVICIRKTKTRNGYRNIPLNILTPESYYREFKKYFKERRKSAMITDLLFPQHDGKIWDTSHISKEIKNLFTRVGIEGVSSHILRHSFANWFLMRWFKAFHGNIIPDNLPFLNNELFGDEYINRLRKLILGMNNQKKGQDTCTYALAVLARLLGHGGPIVTIEKYIHNGDWLFYLLSESNKTENICITSRQAENFLQVSYPSLQKPLKGRGKKVIKPSELLEYQRSNLIKTCNSIFSAK